MALSKSLEFDTPQASRESLVSWWTSVNNLLLSHSESCPWSQEAPPPPPLRDDFAYKLLENQLLLLMG